MRYKDKQYWKDIELDPLDQKCTRTPKKPDKQWEKMRNSLKK
jgi:hypothetical protein